MNDKIGPLYFSRDQLDYIVSGLYVLDEDGVRGTWTNGVFKKFDSKDIKQLALELGNIIDQAKLFDLFNKEYNK